MRLLGERAKLTRDIEQQAQQKSRRELQKIDSTRLIYLLAETSKEVTRLSAAFIAIQVRINKQ